MAVMLIYLDSVRRDGDKARRALRLFRVGERNWGVNVSRSTCRVDRKGGQPRLSLEVHGDEKLSAGEEVSLTVHDAPATEVDGMVEARLGGKGPTASAVLQCAGGRSVEDLCVRLRSDGGVEVFGVAMIQNERQPLRVNWTIQKNAVEGGAK